VTEKQKRQNLRYALPIDGLVIRYDVAKLMFLLWNLNVLVGEYPVRTDAVLVADSIRKEG
jgi:hypothetical protein